MSNEPIRWEDVPPVPMPAHPIPPPAPQVSYQMVETNQRGLRGSHAALIIFGSIIALCVGAPLLMCFIGAIGAASGGSTP